MPLAQRATIAGLNDVFIAHRAFELAKGYHERGRLREAEALYRDGLESIAGQAPMDENKFVARLADATKLPITVATARDRNDLVAKYQGQIPRELAEVLQALGRYPEAEELFERSRAALVRDGRTDHEEEGRRLVGLAGLHRVMGRFDEAEDEFRRGLDLLSARLGAEHEEVGRGLVGLAGLYRMKGRFDEAEATHRRGLKLLLNKVGPDHPDTARAFESLAGLYRALGQYDRAESLARRALQVREVRLGPAHPDVARSLVGLASLYQAMGQPARAEPLVRRGLEIMGDRFGAVHPDVAVGLDELARWPPRRASPTRPGAAEVPRIREARGPAHPDVALASTAWRPWSWPPALLGGGTRSGAWTCEAGLGPPIDVALSLDGLAALGAARAGSTGPRRIWSDLEAARRPTGPIIRRSPAASTAWWPCGSARGAGPRRRRRRGGPPPPASPPGPSPAGWTTEQAAFLRAASSRRGAALSLALARPTDGGALVGRLGAQRQGGGVPGAAGRALLARELGDARRPGSPGNDEHPHRLAALARSAPPPGRPRARRDALAERPPASGSWPARPGRRPRRRRTRGSGRRRPGRPAGRRGPRRVEFTLSDLGDGRADGGRRSPGMPPGSSRPRAAAASRWST
ncbi:MAG: tetratricopeptide repeat protein [Singulisphaera sp.]